MKCYRCKSSAGRLKTIYLSKELALKEAEGTKASVYPCPVNNGWHISSETDNNRLNKNENFNNEYNKNYLCILFFDLVFYVPIQDRNNIKGIKANPYKEGHFLIGGTFLFYYPFCEEKKIKICKHWLWDYENEEKLLKAIIDDIILFKNDSINKIICGDKISRLDIPYLFGRSQKNSIDLDDNLHYLLNTFDIIDLNNIVISIIKNDSNILLPVSTETMNILFLNKKSSKGEKKYSWDHYDNNNYKQIMEHNEEVVKDNLEIYKILIKYENSKNIKNKYLRETFEELLAFIQNEKDKNLVLENFHLSNSNKYYLLNDINMNEMDKFLKNLKLKVNISRIMQGSYNLYKKNKSNCI